MAQSDEPGAVWTRDAAAVRRAARAVLAGFRAERRDNRLARTEAAVSADMRNAGPAPSEAETIPPDASAGPIPRALCPQLRQRVINAIATLRPGEPVTLGAPPAEASGLDDIRVRADRARARIGASSVPLPCADGAGTPQAPAASVRPTAPLTALPRLGPMMAARLQALGIETVADLAAQEAASLATALGPAARYCPLAEWLAFARSACPDAADTAAE